MACHLTATVYLPDDLIATARTRIDRVPKGDAIKAIANELLAVSGPAKRGMIRAFIASAVAEQEITVSASGGAPNDTLVIGGTTLTNKASPASQDEFADAATDAGLRDSVVAAINAHTTINKIVWAVATAATKFKIYAVVPGPIGNLVTLAETGSGFTLGGSVLAGGASDEVDAYECGYNTRAHLSV